MSNWCNTKIGFICDKTNIKELSRLYNSLSAIEKTTCLGIPATLSVPWLGCVALAHGLDYGVMPCTGEITDVGEYNDGDTSFVISTITASGTATELWDEVLKQYEGIRYVYTAEEPCTEFYVNTDVESIWFPERYVVYTHTNNTSFGTLPPDYFTNSITSREFFNERHVFDNFDALQDFVADITGIWFNDLFSMNWHFGEAMKAYDPDGNGIAKVYEYETANTADSDEEPTENYLAQKKAIEKNVGVSDIVKAVDYILLLSKFINSDNEVLDDIILILEPFNKVIEELRTEEKCTRYGGWLYKSDLSQYNYVCPNCDDNF